MSAIFSVNQPKSWSKGFDPRHVIVMGIISAGETITAISVKDGEVMQHPVRYNIRGMKL